MFGFGGPLGSRLISIENGAITRTTPASVLRLRLWKQAKIGVEGRPDWLFIKLHCHGMDPRHKEAIIEDSFRSFLVELTSGAKERKETLHFVTSREMTNIILAACDGKEGNPGEYRDYRYKQVANRSAAARKWNSSSEIVKG